MEQKKSDTSLITILCIILALGLAICIFLLFTQNKKIESSNTDTTNYQDGNKKSEQNKDSQTKEPSVTKNTYDVWTSKMQTERAKYNVNSGYSQYDFVSYANHNYGVQLDGEGNVYIQLDNTLKANFSINQDSYKIADHVLSFYVVKVGQGGGHDIYLIKENGTVTKINIDYSIEKKAISVEENYHNLSDIITVLAANETDGYTGSSTALFVDIHGNIKK